MGRARESQRDAGDICRLHIQGRSLGAGPGLPPFGGRGHLQREVPFPQVMTESLLREHQARTRENPGHPVPGHPQRPTLTSVSKRKGRP